jgi:phage tail-like protein
MFKPRSSILLAAAFAAASLLASSAPARAAEFSVNTGRFDPYKNFKFRVMWDGRVIAGVSKVGPLIRHTDVVEHRAGGDPSTSHKSPGRTEYDAITLERGVTHDTAFEDWADKVLGFGAGLGSEVSLASYRKDVQLQFLNEAGQVAIVYILHRCWPSEYQALPELDANASGVALQHLTLQCEGWERDKGVGEPTEH